MSFYKKVEQIIKQQGDNGLKVLEYYNAIDIDLFTTKSNVASSVYGTASGNRTIYLKTIKGIIINTDFVETSDIFSASFTEGLILSQEKVIVGCIAQVSSEDGRIRRFKVENKQALGNTINIFEQYVIIPTGD